MRIRRSSLLLTVPVLAAYLSSSPAIASSSTSTWPSYHGDPAHTGYSPATPPFSGEHGRWTAKLDGAVYGQPLVADGKAIVATENDTVYALSLSGGHVLWHKHLGTAVPRAALPCGDIDPVGITSTPVYDPATKKVFVVTLTRNGASVKHTLVGLRVTDGRVQLRRGVDVPGTDPAAMNQRGALTLDKSKIYVPYGGNAGDCGNYKGAIVASSETGKGALVRYVVPTPREGGIWTPSGIATDSHGNLFVSIGNGAVGTSGGPYDGSDSVTKLSPSLKKLDLFAPAGWRAENDADQDLGSTGPLLVGKYVWMQGKSANSYLLTQSDLGGIGHPHATRSDICKTQFGGAAAHGNVIFAPCTDGLRQVRITSGGALAPGWRAPATVTGSPVVGGGVVWALSPASATLYALDESTGAVRGTWSVGNVSRFASPTLAGSRVLVPTLNGVTALDGA